MDNIEELLRALSEDEDNENESENDCRQKDEDDCQQENGLFSGLDPEMLLKMLALFEAFNQPDDNERFLLALKPLLREENRAKVDSAIRLMKLFALLPILKDSGIFGKLM